MEVILGQVELHETLERRSKRNKELDTQTDRQKGWERKESEREPKNVIIAIKLKTDTNC